MKLSDITIKTPLVKDFVKRLAQSTKQGIPIVDIEKTKRVGGASVRPVLMSLENGQSVKIYLRLASEDDKLDIFRIDLNGKQIPISGDFDNSYLPAFNISVDAIASAIRSGQKAFSAKAAKQQVKSARSNTVTPKNRAQQRNALLEQAGELDQVIEQKTAEKSELRAQLEQLISK